MKNTVIRSTLRFALLLQLLLLQGCLQTAPMVNISVLKAPEFEEALKFKVFSVQPFGGQFGAMVTRDIDTELASNRVDGRALVRTVPYEVFKQSSSKGHSGADVVDGLISGDVTMASWKDQRQDFEEQECTSYSDKKILGFIPKCKQHRTVKRICTKRTAGFALTLKVTNASDLRTVWGNSFANSTEEVVCKHESDKVLSDGTAMIAASYVKVMDRVRSALIATERKLAVKLIELPDGLSEPEQARFKSALSFAKVNRMDRACDEFGEVFEQNKRSVALTYSVGLCMESRGRLIEATELYKTADSLTTTPTAILNQALARVSLHAKDANKVRGIGAETVIAAVPKPQTIKDQPLTNEQKAQIQGDHRIALVIGNARYRNIAELKNPVNDAQDMEQALRKKGFDVIRVSNGTREQITQAVRSFELKIRDNTTALVFYAGHGVQARGINYLIPVDARILSSADLSTEAIDMDQSIMRRLEDRNPRLSIIILDACRNNPFPTGARGAGEQAGLASISAPRGSIVAFSTAPNKTARDGSGRNGLYTKHLLKEILVPNRKIEDIFKRVRENVMKDSSNEQTPWENSALTGDFYFSANL